jgi:hypothetical protein
MIEFIKKNFITIIIIIVIISLIIILYYGLNNNIYELFDNNQIQQSKSIDFIQIQPKQPKLTQQPKITKQILQPIQYIHKPKQNYQEYCDIKTGQCKKLSVINEETEEINNNESLINEILFNDNNNNNKINDNDIYMDLYVVVIV